MEIIKASPEQKLNNMAQEVKSVEGDSTFMNPGEKKKRGRPKGWKKEAGPQSSPVMGVNPAVSDNTETFKKILQPLWETVSAAAGEITGEEEARMKPQELELMTSSSAACINQYFPNALGQHANLLLFVTVSSIYSGRVWLLYQAKLKMIHELRLKREKEQGQPKQPMERVM